MSNYYHFGWQFEREELVPELPVSKRKRTSLVQKCTAAKILEVYLLIFSLILALYNVSTTTKLDWLYLFSRHPSQVLRLFTGNKTQAEKEGISGAHAG